MDGGSAQQKQGGKHQRLHFSHVSAPHDDSFWKGQVKIALRNCGVIDPENMDDYIRQGGYEAVKKIFSSSISREDVIQMIIDSGLRGRGGRAAAGA